jgi:hypothetical protein
VKETASAGNPLRLSSGQALPAVERHQPAPTVNRETVSQHEILSLDFLHPFLSSRS